MAGPELWEQVEHLGDLTGRSPVPEAKRSYTHFCHDKFAAVGLTPEPAEVVGPPRVRECRLQLEGRVLSTRTDTSGWFLIAEVEVVRVHAAPELVVPGTDHIDPHRWSPLLYNFRHYHGVGPELGHSSRSRTSDRVGRGA